MSGQHHALGGLVSRGNTSDVLQLSPVTVVKLLRPGIPRHWAALEADITSRVHGAGLPAPAVEGLVEIDGRPGIVFERIEGVSMWDRMKASPGELQQLTESLIDLQTEVQAATLLGEVPELGTRLRTKIGEAELLSDEERREALALLATLPTGSALYHGDMHPRNILMSPRGMVIVDWFDAATGHPVADCVRTSLLTRPPSSSSLANSHLDGATRDFLDRLHGTYLSILATRGLVVDAPFAEWEAVLAVARMSEPVPTADLIDIWRSWRTGSDASSSDVEARRPARS